MTPAIFGIRQNAAYLWSKHLIRSLILTVCLMASATAVAQTPEFTPVQRADGEQQIVEAGKSLANSLRNPATAKFRNVKLFKTLGKDGNEHISFCGEVNSENGYGGMSGFDKFTTAGTILIVGRGSFISADVICSDATPRVHDTRDYSPELRKAFDANAGQ